VRQSRLFSFPNPVNEVSARLVAAGVVAMSVLFVATRWEWILIPLAYGFLARVATGPTLSPLGQFVTRVLTPALPLAPKETPGPPKRFAQAIGATLSTAAFVSAYAFDNVTVAVVLVAMILAAASLESFAGFCIGCRLFAALMRAGVIPETVCEECNDIWRRVPAPVTH
jgi:hypothetical protein